MEGDDPVEMLSDNIQYLREDVDELLQTTERCLAELDARQTDSKAKICQFMDEIREKIAAKERDLLAMSEAEFTKCKGELQKRCTNSVGLAREVDKLSSTLNDDKSSANVANSKQSFESLQSWYFQIQDEKICPELVLRKVDVESIEHLKLVDFQSHSKFASEIKDASGAPDLPPPYSSLQFNPEPFDFSCKAAFDRTDPFLTSMIWINGKIIVADKANKKVKFFGLNGDFLQEMVFDNNEPYGVSYLTTDFGTEESYAVTLPKKKSMYFISITQNGSLAPRFKYEVFTKIGYSGIACTNKVLFASAVNIDYPRVDILNFIGEVLRSMALDINQHPLFSYPRYIVADGNIGVVSDWRQNKITFVRQQDSAILGSYSGTSAHPLTDPYDVTVDGKGYIFIMDGRTGKVHVIDRTFHVVRMIEETGQLLSPRLLAFDSHSGNLAVSYSGGRVKCLTAPTAVPNYGHVTPHGPNTVTGMMDNMQLSPPSDSHQRCPSPGF